ncbi:hypothetical protein KC887_02910 [Candidatus Kaiserbacteria bacterium]|nr:hypothetical protein [Candidatus Kaiserbacteria bacterium]
MAKRNNNNTNEVNMDNNNTNEVNMDTMSNAIEAVRQGATLAEACPEGVSAFTFRIALAKAKVKVTRGRSRTWDVNKAFEQVQAGTPAAEVATLCGVTVGSLYTSFNKAGLSLTRAQQSYTEEHAAMARKLYEQGLSLQAVAVALAEAFEDIETPPVHLTTRKMIVIAGGEIRGPGQSGGGGRAATVVSDEVIETIRRMKAEGATHYELAAETGLGLGVLNRVLKEQGLTKSRSTAPAEAEAPEVTDAPDAEALEATTVKGLLGLIAASGNDAPEDKRKASLVAFCVANGIHATA